jgi:hypothetical protein
MIVGLLENGKCIFRKTTRSEDSTRLPMILTFLAGNVITGLEFREV